MMRDHATKGPAFFTIRARTFLIQINGNAAVIAYLTDIFLAADTGLSEGLQATLVTFIQVETRGFLQLCRFVVKFLLLRASEQRNMLQNISVTVTL